MTVVQGLMDNRILISALVAWFSAQTLKVLISLFVQHKLSWQLMFSSGGFPSSHSAAVSALTIGVGRYYGWDSPIFAVAAVFAMIVMYDAAGVRRAAGKQAEVINQLVERYYQGSDISQERLKELIGHTPVEVFGGALTGIIIGILV